MERDIGVAMLAPGVVLRAQCEPLEKSLYPLSQLVHV